jgi:galactosyl transferase GMA12/MNN10 family
MTEMINSKICVLSGSYPETEFKAYVNHYIYCDIHNYTYIYCNWPTKAYNRYMNKIEYIRHYYDLFDYIFWIDDDAFFIDMDKGLEEFLPRDENFLSICSSPDYKTIHTFISSGQFMLRCCNIGKKFIDEISKVDLAEVKKWWDDSLGYFTNGDQDAMVFLLKTHPEFKDRYNRYHYSKFNNRVEEIFDKGGVENLFIVHITGTPKKKLKDYIKMQKYLNRSPSLVDRSIEGRYNPQKKRKTILDHIFILSRK